MTTQVTEPRSPGSSRATPLVAVFARSAHLAARRGWSGSGGLFVAGSFYLAVVAILSELWKTAANNGGGTVAGYSATALVWYVATSESVTIPLPMKMIDDIGVDIAADTVSIEMLRPAPPIVNRVATQIGAAMPRLGVCVVIGVVFAWISGGPPIDPFALALAAPSVLLALLLNVCAQHLFAAAAFWVRDARSAWFIYQKLVFVTGGMLLPLEVLPAALESIARWLPFMAMAYAPARLASGHVEPALLLVQLGWLVVFGAGAALAFHRGQEHLVRGTP